LGLSLLVIVPGALLGILIIVGAIGTGIESGFSATDFLAIALCVVPTILAWWGGKLFFRLYAGFFPRVRRSLLKYYGSVAVYCGLWLASSMSRDGIQRMMFAPEEQAIGVALLFIPFLTVLLMKPDSLPTQPSGNEEAEQGVVGNGGQRV